MALPTKLRSASWKSTANLAAFHNLVPVAAYETWVSVGLGSGVTHGTLVTYSGYVCAVMPEIRRNSHNRVILRRYGWLKPIRRRSSK